MKKRTDKARLDWMDKIRKEAEKTPLSSDNDPYTPRESWLPEIEYGLRSDGVMVWRKKEPTGRTP